MSAIVDRSFWHGRRVFVTGHTGFKGGWLSLWLRRMGAAVAGLSLQPPTTPSLFVDAAIEEAVDGSTIGDVRDPDVVRRAFAAHRPEVVFHLAAQPLVLAGYADPLGTYTTNVIGTANVLEAARLAGGVRAVVNVTTDKCYENREWAWGYREIDRLGGHDPYSSSKGCAELVTAAYRDSFLRRAGIAVASARAGNVIGGGDWAESRLVPDLVKAFVNGTAAVVRNPTAIRPWQHVLEPLAGYLTLAERLCERGNDFAEAWNFGPDDDDARPVSWIADRLVYRWGGSARWELEPAAAGAPAPHEAHYLKLDYSKAKALLGWRPTLSLTEALDWTVEWFQAHRADPAAARPVTEVQIDRFTARLAAPTP